MTVKPMNLTTHEQDFYAWTQEQSQLLKTGQLHQIDWQNIAEEIEDMGRSEKRQLDSRLELFPLVSRFYLEMILGWLRTFT